MDHDIIIVGAGPAGLSTRLHLVELAPELDQRMLILERERRPRPKLCAGGIMPGGEAWLRKLGLDLSDVPSVDVHEAHFLFESRGFVFRRQPFAFRIAPRGVRRLAGRTPSGRLGRVGLVVFSPIFHPV